MSISQQFNTEREAYCWAAALFSGEGSTIAHQQGRLTYLKLRIGQANSEVLEVFREIFQLRNEVYGPYEDKTCLMWRVETGEIERILEILEKMWPWLSEQKKEQAREVTRLYNESRLTPSNARNAGWFKSKFVQAKLPS